MIKLPESELEVMLILWEKNGEEVSVNEVWEALDKQKKITMGALHSYLNRLEEKGFLAFRKEGKYKILRPLVKRRTTWSRREKRCSADFLEAPWGNL